MDERIPPNIVQLPNIGSRVFNPNGPHPLRQKHLFIARFVRGDDTVEVDFPFVIKNTDRPSVEASTETVNQYNKRKVIHTGVKYNPINMTLYDTADNAAMKMWVDYAKFYYGDYTQNELGYSDDVLNNELFDTGEGWGFKVPDVPLGILDGGAGSQHYYQSLQIYQIWGNEFTSYKLLNPRFSSFSPDELTYDNSEVSTVSAAVQFEAIEHVNSGRSQSIFSDGVLAQILGVDFDDDILDVSGPISQTSFVERPFNDFSDDITDQLPLRIQINRQGAVASIGNTQLGVGLDGSGGIGTSLVIGDAQITLGGNGGVLARYGNFFFEDADRFLSDGVRNSAFQDNIGFVGDGALSRRNVAVGLAVAPVLGNVISVNTDTPTLPVNNNTSLGDGNEDAESPILEQTAPVSSDNNNTIEENNNQRQDIEVQSEFTGFGYQVWDENTYTFDRPLVTIANQTVDIPLSIFTNNNNNLKGEFAGHNFIKNGRISTRNSEDVFILRVYLKGRSNISKSQITMNIIINNEIVDSATSEFSSHAGVDKVMAFGFNTYSSSPNVGGKIQIHTDNPSEIWEIAIKFEPGL